MASPVMRPNVFGLLLALVLLPVTAAAAEPPRPDAVTRRSVARAHALSSAGNDVPQIVYLLNEALAAGEPRFTVAEVKAMLARPAPPPDQEPPAAAPPPPAEPVAPLAAEKRRVAPPRRLRIRRLHEAGFSPMTIARELNQDRPDDEPEWTAAGVTAVVNETLREDTLREADDQAPPPRAAESRASFDGPALGVDLLGQRGIGGGVFAAAWTDLIGAEARIHLLQARLEDDKDNALSFDAYLITAGLRVLLGPTVGRFRPGIAFGFDVDHAELKTTDSHSTGVFFAIGGRLDVLVADQVIAGVTLLEYRHQLQGELHPGRGRAPSIDGAGFEVGLFSARVAYLFR